MSSQAQQASGNKRLNTQNTPLNLNESKRHKSMPDPLHATSNRVSCESPLEESRPVGEVPPSGGDVKRRKPSVRPGLRTWENVSEISKRDGPSLRFRVLSYNVLAQCLLECHPYLYTSCTPRNLKWNVRATRLYAEITSYKPDILCFQEVQKAHLNSIYAKLQQKGYFGIFKSKTGRDKQDGCAIYFKRSLFYIQEQLNVEFYQPELPILNRANIGMIVKLVPYNFPSSSVVVATTHLLYNPRRTDIRLAQMQVFLAEIDRFAYYNNGRESGYLPIILTGDFNSTPDSAVIELLDKGQVSAVQFRDNSDWKRIGITDNCQHLAEYLNRHGQVEGSSEFLNIKIYNTKNCRQHPLPSDKFNEMFKRDIIAHSLRLSSVYNKSRNEVTMSTYTGRWVMVDYIYYSNNSSLRLVERLRLPTAAECKVLGCLPNDVYGSDHLAVAATFELKPPKPS